MLGHDRLVHARVLVLVYTSQVSLGKTHRAGSISTGKPGRFAEREKDLKGGYGDEG